MAIKLDELKKHFYVFKFKSKYQIFDLDGNSGRMMRKKYLCSLKRNSNSGFKIIKHDKANDNVKLEKKYYYNITDLKFAIGDYVNSLEFDSEFYYPEYRDGYFEFSVINDYLTNKGFKHGHSFSSDNYRLINKNIYGDKSNEINLVINGIDYFNDELSEEVTIKLILQNYSWIDTKCKREVHEIMEKIDSLLKPLFLYDAGTNIEESDKYTYQMFDADLKVIDNNLNCLTAEYKTELKSKITKMLEKL